MKESSMLFWEKKLGTPDAQVKEWEEVVNNFENLDSESDGYYQVSDLVDDPIIPWLEADIGAKIDFDKKIIDGVPGTMRFAYNGGRNLIFHRDGPKCK